MLGRGDRDLAAMQHGSGILRGAGRHADARLLAGPPVQIADDNGDAVEALCRQVARQPVQRRDGGVHEGLTQGQVLDWVTGQHHLGEDHDARALLGGAHGPLDHLVAVARQVSDCCVDLGEPDPELRHDLSLIGPARSIAA
jgi:hypothetical protein